MAKIDKVFRVKERCFLEYPNGEVWAKQGEFVCIDYDNKTMRTWMHGQESRVRNLTKEEREAGVEVVDISDKFRDAVEGAGYRPPVDRMFRLGGAKTKAAPKKKRKLKPEPDPEPALDFEAENSEEIVEK